MLYADDIPTEKRKDLHLKVVRVKGDEVFKVPGLKINVSSYLKKNHSMKFTILIVFKCTAQSRSERPHYSATNLQNFCSLQTETLFACFPSCAASVSVTLRPLGTPHTQVELCSVCLSGTGLFHRASCPPGPSLSWQVSERPPFSYSLVRGRPRFVGPWSPQGTLRLLPPSECERYPYEHRRADLSGRTLLSALGTQKEGGDVPSRRIAGS